jgi:hypothetical protein
VNFGGKNLAHELGYVHRVAAARVYWTVRVTVPMASCGSVS